MKITFASIALPLLVMVIMSFTSEIRKSPRSFDCIGIVSLENLNEDGWGSWEITPCYRGLDFRVENRGANYDGRKYKWGVQFRNRYEDKIYFSYEVYESRPINPSTSDRTDVDPGKTSSGIMDYSMNSATSIYVYVTKV